MSNPSNGKETAAAECPHCKSLGRKCAYCDPWSYCEPHEITPSLLAHLGHLTPPNAPADLPRTGDAEHPKTLPIEAQRE